MSFLHFPQPLETSLQISYYDPEKLKKPKASKKRPSTREHSLSNIDTQTGARCNLQKNDLGTLIENPLRLPIAKTPSDTLGQKVYKVSSRYSVQEMTIDQLIRQRIQHGPSIAISRGMSPSLHTADQHTHDTKSNPDKVEFVGRQNLAADSKLSHKINH